MPFEKAVHTAEKLAEDLRAEPNQSLEPTAGGCKSLIPIP
jgi:hypothetical protein